MKLIGLCITAAVLAGWQPACAQAQFDGHWTGTYECGPHAYKPLPNFSWPVSIDIKDGTISGQYAYQVRLADGGKAPATVTFNGTIDGIGDAKITAIARKADRTEDFHQTLVRSVATATEIRLAGPMLGQGDARLRDCTLTLRTTSPGATQADRSPTPKQSVSQTDGYDLDFIIANDTPWTVVGIGVALSSTTWREADWSYPFTPDTPIDPKNEGQTNISPGSQINVKFLNKVDGSDASCTYDIGVFWVPNNAKPGAPEVQTAMMKINLCKIDKVTLRLASEHTVINGHDVDLTALFNEARQQGHMVAQSQAPAIPYYVMEKNGVVVDGHTGQPVPVATYEDCMDRAKRMISALANSAHSPGMGQDVRQFADANAEQHLQEAQGLCKQNPSITFVP
jgi:hypothetical protein